jgi:hypothetical protein
MPPIHRAGHWLLLLVVAQWLSVMLAAIAVVVALGFGCG